MGHIHGLDRQQRVLFPDSLDDYIDEANPVRFLDAFVDSLDLHELGFRHAIPHQIGRPSYHPGDLLKLYLYGYLNKIRSSRKLEHESQRKLELLWFGTMKRGREQGDFLTRGLAKVRGEMSLTVLVYNLKRVLNILGMEALIAAVG